MITEFSVDVDTLNLSDSKSLPVIRVRGEIDIYTCSELRKTLASTIESSATDFLLNLENVQYIDSTGLGTIAIIVLNEVIIIGLNLTAQASLTADSIFFPVVLI